MDQHPPIVIAPEEHVVLGEADFGAPGLVAVESIGPFGGIRACGPLITVHDSIIAAHQGIGHHLHRYNERLFYVERGTFEHDDSLNGVSRPRARGGPRTVHRGPTRDAPLGVEPWRR